MIIDTLTTNSYLFKVSQNRKDFQTKLDKRRTFMLVCLISVCVTISTVLWITYS
jgi:hypothetical protein